MRHQQDQLQRKLKEESDRKDKLEVSSITIAEIRMWRFQEHGHAFEKKGMTIKKALKYIHA